MIYYQDQDILIRNMQASDAPIITEEEIAQGWHQTVEKYEMILRDQAEGKCISLVAEYQSQVAGYINVYWDWTITAGAFAGKGYPEIVDFGVLEKFRRRGIGSKLMDAAEQIAREKSDTVCLGVGLYESYGSAQRMYVKRGYIPDGSGIWYADKPCEPYGTYDVDDSLVLFFSKKLD